MYGSQWGSLIAACSLYKGYFLLVQVTHESVSVLQVTHAASECAMKSKVRMIKSLSSQYQATSENITHNNTDGNKLMIFSGIALYYGDAYILSVKINYLWSKITPAQSVFIAVHNNTFILKLALLSKKLVENKIFAEKTFADCLLLLPIVAPEDATPPNFTEKTFANSH